MAARGGDRAHRTGDPRRRRSGTSRRARRGGRGDRAVILIERLAAHNFKQLRDVDLTIPASCQVLIEGLNEAGKSTFFEAVHFALYGRGLVTRGRGQGST